MEDLRIVLLGKSGVGKSSLCNTILGKDVFTVGHTANSETTKCETITIHVNGRRITLIDAPGFFGTNRSEENLSPELAECITECAPGPHAFLIVLKVERFTEHENAVINKITKYFSEEVLKYAVVVFTHGEQLSEGKKIEDFVKQNKSLEDLVEKCGKRCHVIDNKYWNRDVEDQYRNNQFQVEQLLKTIDKIMQQNQGGCYTKKVLQAVQEEIKQEEERIRQSSGNMSGEEIREQAEARVCQSLWIRAAGVSAGALTGAHRGVLLMGAGEAPILKKALNLIVGGAARLIAGGGPSVGAAAAAAAAGGGASGTTVPSHTIGAAALGAVAGGVRGYYAAEEAKTPWQAAEMAAKAVKDNTLYDSLIQMTF